MKSNLKKIFIIFLIMAFLAGLYVYLSVEYPEKSTKESFDNQTQMPSSTTSPVATEPTSTFANNQSSCPDLLIQQGKILLLYNTKLPTDASNPITFASLADYTVHLEAQRRNGINCPVLYLQQESNAQGADVYRMRPSPYDLQGGLPTMTTLQTPQPSFNSSTLISASPGNNVVTVVDAGRENVPYNSGNYPSFDPQNQYVGVYTNLDKTHDSTMLDSVSDNPMDWNWGGVQYTNKAIESGKYEDNNVRIPVLYQPKNVATYPIPGGLPQPKDII